MDVHQVRAARREMEAAIRGAVIGAMSSFEEKTGLCPESINIYLVDVSTFCDSDKRYTVAEVVAGVKL